MPGPYVPAVFEAVDRLRTLPRLEPSLVAEALGRRARIDHDDEYLSEFTLVGGPALPFPGARAWWRKIPKNGEVHLEVAPEVGLTTRDLRPAFDAIEGSFFVPDRRTPNGKFGIIFRLPKGEFQVYCRDKRRDEIDLLVLSEECSLHWGPRPLPAEFTFPAWYEHLK